LVKNTKGFSVPENTTPLFFIYLIPLIGRRICKNIFGMRWEERAERLLLLR